MKNISKVAVITIMTGSTLIGTNIAQASTLTVNVPQVSAVSSQSLSFAKNDRSSPGGRYYTVVTARHGAGRSGNSWCVAYFTPRAARQYVTGIHCKSKRYGKWYNSHGQIVKVYLTSTREIAGVDIKELNTRDIVKAYKIFSWFPLY